MKIRSEVWEFGSAGMGPATAANCREREEGASESGQSGSVMPSRLPASAASPSTDRYQCRWAAVTRPVAPSLADQLPPLDLVPRLDEDSRQVEIAGVDAEPVIEVHGVAREVEGAGEGDPAAPGGPDFLARSRPQVEARVPTAQLAVEHPGLAERARERRRGAAARTGRPAAIPA